MRVLSASLSGQPKFLAAAACCLLWACSFPAAQGQNPPVKFNSPTPIATGPYTGGYKVVTGFFNRDTKPDFMYSAINFDGIGPRSFAEVVLNSGNGNFTVPSTNYGDVGPDLAVDLNGDGITDVLYYNPQLFGPGLDVKYGVGDGTFANETGFNVDSAFSYVLDAVAGDFNGDGATDLAVLTDANQLVIMLNDRHGALAPAFSYPLPAPPSSTAEGALSVGDLNGDGRPDVVLTYTGPNGTITPYLATTGGAFRKGTSFTVGGNVRLGAAVADVNSDGHGDLAVVTSGGTKIFLGSATATFTLASTISIQGLLAFADFNKDGKMDLAIAGSNYASVSFGKNNGTFQNPTVYGAAGSTVALIAVDVVGSGNIDLVTASYDDGTLYRMQNDGNGYFAAPPITLSPGANGIVAADFNRDGNKDVAVVNTPQCKSPCRGSVSVFPGSGKNYFNPAAKYTIGMHGSAIAAGDVNGDGILDLVVANSLAGDTADTSVLLGNKDGTFQAAHNYTLGSLSSEVFLVDLNNDGKLDLVEHGGVAVGKGDGSFATFVPLPSGLSSDPSLHLAVGDLNGDGKQDLIGATSSDDGCTGNIQVLLGNGKGGFTLGQNVFLDTPENINSVALGRLRPGGALDVVYSSVGICGIQSDSETISLAAGFLGNGNGTFNAAGFNVTFGGDVGPPTLRGPVVIADLNGDGKMDVGVGAGDYFVVSNGKGDGTFPVAATFRLAGSNGIAIADFDSDGRPDVAITSPLGVSRLYNITPRLH